MAPVEQGPEQHRDQWQWKLGLSWIAVTFVVMSASLLMPGAYLRTLPDDAFVGDNGILPLGVLGCGLVLGIGLLLGLAQGVVLTHAGVTKNASSWAAVSALGAAVSPSTLGYGVNGNVIFATALLGVMQWLVLRRYVLHAYWWIGVNAIGGGIALLIGRVIAEALFPDDPVGFVFHSARSADHWSVL